MKKLNKSLTFSMILAITFLSVSFGANAEKITREFNLAKSNMSSTKEPISFTRDKSILCIKFPQFCKNFYVN